MPKRKIDTKKKRKSRKKRLYEKGFFVVPADPYSHDIGICVDLTLKEVLKRTEHKRLRELLNDHKDCFDNVKSGKKLGMALFIDETSHTLIILPKPVDEWQYWEILMHELHHIVTWIAEMKMLDKEIEAQAYLQEHLFRTIRRKLQGI